ncbi:MAG: hypothetical protein AMXMBFR84_05780 [Candidatus Hydrogenedentota bacterium]
MSLNGLLYPSEASFGDASLPAGTQTDRITHALNRFAFGPWPGEYARVGALGIDAYLEEQLHPESIDDSDCDWRVRRLESLSAPVGTLFEYKQDYLLREMSEASVLRAVYSKRQLQEVLVEFWTDHFNVSPSKGDCAWLKAADDRDVIRKHALGRFPDMVKASVLSPAMLWYLDGRVNRRATADEQPNENYARELLELHTLGVHGGYSQRDVMEAARCLTGWYVRSDEVFRKGRVEFRAEWHDDGEKKVLGQQIPAGGGQGDLDRLVTIVCGHPATARYIAEKLCRRFISVVPPEAAVQAVTAAFQQSHGDIKATLRALFSHETFWASANQSFKRPFHFVVSALRATGADMDGSAGAQDYLTRMGHAPFQYPTPDGYPIEPEPWYGGMLWRWHFAAALADGRVEGTTVDWPKVQAWAQSPEGLMTHLLGRVPSKGELDLCTASGKGPAFLIATPAFQQC